MSAAARVLLEPSATRELARCPAHCGEYLLFVTGRFGQLLESCPRGCFAPRRVQPTGATPTLQRRELPRVLLNAWSRRILAALPTDEAERKPHRVICAALGLAVESERRQVRRVLRVLIAASLVRRSPLPPGAAVIHKNEKHGYWRDHDAGGAA